MEFSGNLINFNPLLTVGPFQVSVEEEEASDEDMEALADMVATEMAAGVDLGDDGGDEGGEDGEGGEEEEEDPNEFVHVDEKFYYLVLLLLNGLC